MAYPARRRRGLFDEGGDTELFDYEAGAEIPETYSDVYTPTDQPVDQLVTQPITEGAAPLTATRTADPTPTADPNWYFGIGPGGSAEERRIYEAVGPGAGIYGPRQGFTDPV